MNKKQYPKFIASLLAVALGIVSFFSGFTTLIGYSVPDKIIFFPLLISQTIMGIINVIVAWMIFRETRFYFAAAIAVFSVNLIIFLLITAHLGSGGTQIDPSSQKAMLMRTIVWAVITGLLSFQLKMKNSTERTHQ